MRIVQAVTRCLSKFVQYPAILFQSYRKGKATSLTRTEKTAELTTYGAYE
jgi:hypothetical protein